MIQSHPNLYRMLQNDPTLLNAVSRFTHPGAALAEKIHYPVAPPARVVIDHTHHHDNCGCKKDKKEKGSIADFMVNVPCPKSTTKAPKVRKVVVKVPCPTTEKSQECSCQCCPCNPCDNKKQKKKPKKESCSSEESKEHVKTIVRSYEPPKKQHNEVRHPYHIHRINLAKSSEEDHKMARYHHGNHHRYSRSEERK